jgi:4-amino-4-deoxy-L-arabinose transferase-like glycosyltransferase
VALVLLWLVATCLNVTKPFHVDDAFYVAEARWIAAHPDRPTSGLVFWEGDGPVPFHRVGNHSPLVPAVQAAVIAATGEEPLSLHLLTSVFAAIVVLLAHALARRHAPEHALAVTALLVLSPAFVAEQNVMLDIPLLACWLAFFVALEDARPRGLLASAAALALGLLVKLSSIVLVVVLVLAIVERRRARQLTVAHATLALAVPVGALGLWALASHAETGEIAFVARSADALGPGLARPWLESVGVGLGRAGLFVIVLGGVAPAALVAVPAHLARRSPRALGLVAIATLALVIVGRTLVLEVARAHQLDALADEPLVHSILRVVDLVLGACLVALAAIRARHGDRTDRRLGLWLALGALACVGLAPFVAARHVLLVLPPLWLLLARHGLLGDRQSWPRDTWTREPTVRASIALAALIGLATAVADHRLASVYAEHAPLLAASAREERGAAARLYFVGHWGWQEHAEHAGLAPYVPGQTELRAGDVVIEPLGVHAPRLAPDDRARLSLHHVVEVPAGALDALRTMIDREGLYVSWHGLPWTVRAGPVERFVVQVVR